MTAEELRERILSDEYLDIIRNFSSSPELWQEMYASYGAQPFGGGFGMVHISAELFSGDPMESTGYYSIPKLFAPLDTTSLEVSGVLSVQTQPFLGYKGKGVILGFLDTGIDYTLPAFRRSDGSTRILNIWDQEIQSGTSPEGFFYGSEYTKKEIQAALDSSNPFAMVPSRDMDGHGTMVAGIAAGSEDTLAGFSGAAPEADLVMVKLKAAKENLRNYFHVPKETTAFQETDLCMGIRYLYSVSVKFQKPLVLCISLGSNQGSHTGASPLAQVLDYYSGFTGCYSVAACGNEAGRAHHYYGKLDEDQAQEKIELLVNQKEEGFSLELWGQPPALYSIGITSPLGETINRIPARLGQSVSLRFTLEKTVISLYYEIVEAATGNEVILLRFQSPTPGLWTIHVYQDVSGNGIFHMWLPITGLISTDTYFLAPNPDTTLTTPSDSSNVITVSTYNPYTNGLYIHSSRGYTLDGRIKPDLAAPGVDVYGPASSYDLAPGTLNLSTGEPRNYQRYTGSSVAAALTAGAVALLVNWGMDAYPDRPFTNLEVKGFLIRGTTRNPSFLYPNREWGYGTLNLYQIFFNLMNP